MKSLLILAFSTSCIFAQYAPTTNGSTTAQSEINGKINWQTSTAACADKNGTVGKDLCQDTGTLKVYKVTVSGSPATWADVAATAGALAATPTLCSSGQAPTGILPNGNATGCAAAAGSVTSFVATNQTTTSTSFVDLTTPDTVTVNCASICSLIVSYIATVNVGASAGVACANSVYIDTVQVDSGSQFAFFAGTGFAYAEPSIATWKAVSQSAGSHVVDIKHDTNNGTSCGWQTRLLSVQVQ